MELTTVAVGLLMLRYVQFPFLTFPIAFALWYLSMDLTPLVFGQGDFNWDQRKWVSVVFGTAMLIATYFIDRRTKEDFAFWCYLFGLLAFWSGLTAMNSNSEIGKFIYCMINLGLLFAAVFLSRRIFAVFGGIGIFIYTGHLAGVVFKDELAFPVVMSLIGLGVIWIGIAYQKNKNEIDGKVLGVFPSSLLRLRPIER
jgi:hypothetical protein